MKEVDNNGNFLTYFILKNANKIEKPILIKEERRMKMFS